MSSGKRHAQASKILAPVAGLGTGVVCHAIGCSMVDSVLAGLGAGVGCGVLGLVLGPDLDQQGITNNERRMGILAGVWIMIWWFYAVMIKHRSSWSHAPVLGTIVRLVYLLWLPAWYIMSRGVQVPGWAMVVFAGMVVGLMVSDTAHWVMDRMRTG